MIHYILMFVITTIIATTALYILTFVSQILDNKLVKNHYTAYSLMKDNVSEIEYMDVLRNNGGLQVIDSEYRVVFSKGINHFSKGQLTASEFTDFLTQAQSTKRNYSYSIAYNEEERFWLIITFPTSLRIDFNVTHNSLYKSVDSKEVVWFTGGVALVYLLMLAISTIIYSRMTATSFTKPLARLRESANRLRNGDYSARADMDIKNEFGDLGRSFNEMADKIQEEIELRKKLENTRRQLTLDIAHDLKNPLAVIMGYAEYCLNNPDDAKENQIRAIYQNSSRANSLITNLFELSKLESPEYKLNIVRVDIAEYLRVKLAKFVETLESEGFTYDFEIPEGEIYLPIDEKEMDRVFDNLFDNSIRYCERGGRLSIALKDYEDYVEITLEDEGKGIPKELSEEIFKPFARVDVTRNSETGGSGLGLAIVKKIIEIHGGGIALDSDLGKGCKFIITLPKI
ncbi:HAMP domain-containing histidine kinase [Alkaliphilus serpentinus]|uniref:histidine kinase n=2 Tax=Alkaliphilus serpentinus TaxID=1482731 RepID=A0A833HL86_9FIRM|nr:HAMP domain-containing histidine kinase [Alkaliphilus serpentinus]